MDNRIWPERISIIIFVLTITILCSCSPDLLCRDVSKPMPVHRIANSASDLSFSVNDKLGKLPMSFEENRGQANSEVRFVSRGRGARVDFASSEVTLRFWNFRGLDRGVGRARADLGTGEVKIRLLGANLSPQVVGMDPLQGRSNFLFGNNAQEWITNVPTYSKVRYKNVYPGIDVVYYGNHRQLEHDFILAPGANADHIRITYAGVDRVEVGPQGDLLLHTPAGIMRQSKPEVFQFAGKQRKDYQGQYRLFPGQQVGFSVSNDYDRSLPLTIDPVLIFSTYLGGATGLDEGRSIAIDQSGSVYVTGITQSTDFPTRNAIYIGNKGQTDVFVTKLNSAGSDIIYSTYLGGSYDDIPYGIAVDLSGNVYVTGSTLSANFLNVNAIYPNFHGGIDAFVTKINPQGSAAVFSTYLGGGGNDIGRGIAVDSSNNVYVAGVTDSANYPSVNPLQTATPAGKTDVFLTRINAGGNRLDYSTYLGGSDEDEAFGIACDPAGNVWLTGRTASTNFRVENALQPSLNQGAGSGNSDAFVMKVSPDPDIVYSTYLGGTGNETGYAVAVDSSGNAYVTGTTTSTNFPIRGNVFQKTLAADSEDGFVAKINPQGSALVFSSFLTGNTGTEPRGIAVDSAGNAYLTGATRFANFPRISPLQSTMGGGTFDAFVMRINPTGSDLLYSSYLGGSGEDYGYGIAVNNAGEAYVTGYTSSPNFPTANPYQATLAGGTRDGFVSKISSASGNLQAKLFVPVVLSATGLSNSFFTSEMTLTNRGSQNTTLYFNYTPSPGGPMLGPGMSSLDPFEQKIIPDAIVFLKSLGLALPASGSQVGTLSVGFAGLSSSADGAVTIRTTTAVANGRAGLAYAGIPSSAALTGTSYIGGLRQTESDRSNVAIQNAGGSSDGNVVLRLTVFSGDLANLTYKDLPDETLSPGGFKQFSGILASNGLSLRNGWVRIQRVGGTAPYYAYGVINDQRNSDGSFITPIPENALTGRQGLTLPVIVETPAFSSELILTNWGNTRKVVNFSYVADAIGTPDKAASFSLIINPREQMVIPALVQSLRTQGIPGIGPAGPTFAGALFASVTGGDVGGLFLGARTSTPGGGGRFGLFYTAVPYGAASTNVAWLYGLQQDALNRTNLALVNTGEVDNTSDTFNIDVYNGDTGLKASTFQLTVGARRWVQLGSVLSQYAPATTQGYAQITRISGGNPFIAYSVINDGGSPNQRTGDGAFVQSSY